MANFCTSRLIITGDSAQVAAAMDTLCPNGEVTLAAVLPLPEGATSTHAYKHWQTRCEAQNTWQLKVRGERARVNFRTIGHTPSPVIAELARRYPALNFVLDYYEEDHQAGRYQWHEGNESFTTGDALFRKLAVRLGGEDPDYIEEYLAS